MRNGIRGAFMMLALMGSVPGVLRAQSNALDQGHFAVDGQASLVSSGGSGNSDRQTLIHLSPTVLYFVRPGIALGGSAQFGRSSGGNASSWAYSVGPQVAVYFGDESASMRPFISAQAGIGRSSNTSTVLGSTTQHIDYTHVGANAGLMDLVTSSVGIHGELYYQRDSYGGDGNGYTDGFGVAFGFSIFLGG